MDALISRRKFYAPFRRRHSAKIVCEFCAQHNSPRDLPYPKQVTVMLAALAHDFGKPATTAFVDGRTRSRDHEEAGVPATETFLDRLNLHTLDGYDVRAQVIALVRDHLKPGEFYKKH